METVWALRFVQPDGDDVREYFASKDAAEVTLAAIRAMPFTSHPDFGQESDPRFKDLYDRETGEFLGYETNGKDRWVIQEIRVRHEPIEVVSTPPQEGE